MAIQLRRGEYSNFDPTKLLAGEVAVVQSGDSATSSGKTAYLSFGSGTVKRLVTEEELGQVADDLDDHITDFEGDVAALEQTLGNISSTATAALTKANDNENAIAEANTAIAQLRTELDNVSINPDDLGLYQDPDTYYVYPTYKDVVSENGIPLAASGGGGGGSSTNAVLTVSNTTGWLSKTIAYGTDCSVSLTWSSIEDELPTGNGTIRISVGDVVKTSYEIEQGSVSVNLKPYLGRGSNKVKVRISDVYDQGKTITFTITTVELSVTSSFDPTTPFDGIISVPYTPVGEVQKTVHFVLDGTDLETVSTSASGRQLTYTIPSQTHGAHTLSIYFTATINNETVTSNVLYYEFMSVVSGTSTPIVTSQYNTASVPQYTTIQIPYQVYTPNALTSSVDIYANNVLQTTLTVDRTEQTYSYRADEYGALAIKIQSGSVYKTINITVTESEIDVEAETENLVLYLSSYGRSNSEANPDTWTYGTGNNAISATFSGFNWTSDGWLTDSDGITVLRCLGTARVTIPYKPFASDFRTSGKTIEIEFATRNVLDYDAVIMSCFSGDRGFKITPQSAMLKSEQSQISIQYKEDEHIRVAFVAEKRSENRLLYVYINGIPSGVVQYDTNDDFSQSTPVNISIGSSDCAIDIYCIRIYDNDLTRYQILNNWIADTQIGVDMLARYTRNNVFDAYDNIVVEKLPTDLPYFILNAPQLPQYKGDKKTITGSYVNRLNPSKSFTFTGCQINVQGTSSAPYARKNYDMQFKEGFELATGHADNYQLQTGNVPFNRFVLKADVASSEGANNVELVRLYNDACPYKTPEMVEDSRVRWGIDGFPIVVFWNNTTTGYVSFLGKYNFNLPKRAPGPYGYADDDTMESWEFQNNTSDLMVFKSDYFDETMYTDPDTGETKELWRYDYEARFPSDEWTNYAKLQEFQSFVYSTYRANATGDALSESVTYDGVTYTNDTSAYRLAKFRAEFPTYAELSTFLFYYIFTELLLMVDSRAKNLFIGFNGSAVTETGRVATRKATAQPYDMDTGLGTNNEGSLVFGYSLEDTDHLTGGANIFNGQDSVLWCNVRDAFDTEIRQMYQTLRSGGTLSYATLESRYEEHQEKWPEAIWIEDSWFKYIDPLIAPDTGKEPTDVYLPMMQGSKEQQRKWWLSNRFKYMDSKWNAGDALSQVIQLRGYAKADITVTPYTDIYPTVKYASYVVQARGTHGQPTTLVCPLSTVNDTEIYIYSAPQIESVGDLSGLKVGFADFSMATRLQSIKVGDSDANYENPNMKTFTVGNNDLLKTVDARNCSALGTDTQKSVDLSGCPIIENVYFTGTAITGVSLPNGGVLKVLQLPDTITNLTVLNQSQITTFSIEGGDYSNITTLRIENCSSVIPVLDILADMEANSRVRIIGFTATVSTTQDVEDFFDFLDTMRGLDEYGNNVDNAVVSGTITGLGTITGSWLAEMYERYPNVTIEYEHLTSYLYYYNGDTLYYTETITDGGNGTYSGTPSKTATAQYTYTFAGWSKENDNTVDADARQNVTYNRNVYACYTSTVRTYTVYFYNGSTLLQTVQNVAYGSSATYTGSTPVNSEDSSLAFLGWSPQPTNITGNTSCYAQFDSGFSEITDSWDQIIASIDDGTYSTKYELGDYKSLDLGSEGVVRMQLVGFDYDSAGRSTEDYKMPMTFIAMDVLNTKHRMNPELVDYTNTPYVSGQGGIDGWGKSEMRGYLCESIGLLIPENIRKNIHRSLKRYKYATTSNSTTVNNINVDEIWIPALTELQIDQSEYTSRFAVYKNNASRIKYKDQTPVQYISRTTFSGANRGFLYVDVTGVYPNRYHYSQTNDNIAIGFSLGTTRETITDTWEEIFEAENNGSYSTKYSVGDTKMVYIAHREANSSYNVIVGNTLMQIVAIDQDVLSDGTGNKAKLTWMSVNIHAIGRRFNPQNSGDNAYSSSGYDGYDLRGGWEESELRGYLDEVIYPAIQQNVRQNIKSVFKNTYSRTLADNKNMYITTSDKLWIPSYKEMTGQGNETDSQYSVYSTSDSRAKRDIRTWNTNSYYLRTHDNNGYLHKVLSSGGIGTAKAYNIDGIVLGFCT